MVRAFLLTYVVPVGLVLLGGDDTARERPGPKVFGKGRQRDGMGSTHSYTAYRSGYKWVVLSVLVKFPFAITEIPIYGSIMGCEPVFDSVGY
jgi:hypothetical protein